MSTLRISLLMALALAATVASPARAQNCGWSQVDHRLNYDASGLWNPNAYKGLVGALTLAQVGGAVYEGAESRLGKTMWQGIDAELISAVSTQVGKRVFTRARPGVDNNPCQWSQGGSNDSFPSSESAVAAALVTPYILEYGAENPATYLLALVPLYVGVARLKNQMHWQSDVLAGWGIGALSGWYAHSRQSPITVQLLPRGVAIGFKKQF